jgi:two-component system sensor kinase FixL
LPDFRQAGCRSDPPTGIPSSPHDPKRLPAADAATADADLSTRRRLCITIAWLSAIPSMPDAHTDQSRRRHRSISLISVSLAAVIFAIDVQYPPGLTIPALYLVPLLLSLRQLHRRDTFTAAAGCSALTVLGLLLSPANGDWTAGVTNRAFVIAGLWITAFVIARFKQTLTAQQRTSARIRAILETAVDAVLVIDTRGIVQLANPAVTRLFGYTPGEVVGQNVSMLMPSPDRERHDGYLARYLQTAEKRIIGIGREVIAQRKDGRTFPAYLSVSEMKVHGEHTFTGIIYDLTERKRLEAQLRERAELARLGQMASLVAHEVRNPLAGIRGALQVIGARMPAESREQAVLRDVIGRVDALNSFVNDLLVFSRPKPPDVRRVPLKPMVHRLVEHMRQDPQCANVTFELNAADVVAEIDQAQIERALLNLVTNAVQAIEGTGRIAIGLESADHVCRISVADSGPGIPADVQEHIFEPFFTTKHRGTGLGLPITRRTIELHGGSIAIASTSERGTTLVVTLPLAHPEIVTQT